MESNLFIVKASLTLALFSPGWSLASEVVSNEAPLSAIDACEIYTAPAASIETTVVAGFGEPMVGGQLDGYRGGFDVVNNDMRLSGSVSNNSATEVMSGSNYIASGSFANSSGIPMVVQNSGSNVLIQNATIINLQYQ